MKNRVISFLLIIAMVTTPVMSGHADEGLSIDKTIERLLEYSVSERESMISLLIPLLIIDSGLTLMVGLIEGYDPSSDNMFDKMLRPVMDFTDAQSIIYYTKFIGVAKESVRSKYALDFISREEFPLTGSAKEDMEYIMESLYDNHAGLRQLFLEHEINAGVLANLTCFVRDINDAIPLLTNGVVESDFGINKISPSLITRAQNKGVDIKPYLEAFVSFLNEALDDREKTAFKNVLKQTGVYTDAAPAEIPKSGSTITELKREEGKKITYEITTVSGETHVKVREYVGETEQKTGRLSTDIVLKIPVSLGNVMVYKLEGENLAPQKYSAVQNNELLCRISSTGDYVVKSVPNYFGDVSGWGQHYVESLYHRGIISGKGERVFAPHDNVTREEFVKLAVELFQMLDETAAVNFSDVDKTAWYYEFIASAYKNNIIAGIGDNLFGVGLAVTRQDMAKILFGMLSKRGIEAKIVKQDYVIPDGETIDEYAKESVAFLYSTDVLSGDEQGNFNPKANATRQEAAKIIYGAMRLYIESAIND